MTEQFPVDVKQFIVQHIESLAQLELLLYLREHSAEELHSDEIAHRLAIPSEMSATILKELASRDFATKTEAGFRYKAASNETDRLIGLLADAYRSRRLAVTNEIYARPIEKVKTFAEAFRLRKET